MTGGQCAVLNSLVNPVGVIHVAVGVVYRVKRSPVNGRETAVQTSLIHNSHILLCIKHLELASYGLPTHISVVGDLA